MAGLTKMLKYRSEQGNRILLIDPHTFASESRSIKEDWSNQLRQLQVKTGRRTGLEIEVWDAQVVRERLRWVPPLELRYFPDDVPDGRVRLERIEAARRSYLERSRSVHGKIQFVGMSVYKEEATAAVNLESLYIPLRLVGEAANESDPATPRVDPLRLLGPGERHVILGDPGSGKSTLLKFLAIARHDESLRKRFQIEADDRLPILVILRELAEALRAANKADIEFDLLEHIVSQAAAQLVLPDLGREFFEFFMIAGRAVLFFDGIDELPGLEMKCDVRQRIGDFLRKYPGNTTVVTSRIVGYDQHIRYETLGFGHHRVARLAPDEIEEFIGKWYRVRIPLGPDRQRNILDLVGIIKNPDSHARQAIRPRGKTGQMLADPNSGNAGGNRAERAPDLPRCVGLGVPGLELARSAHQHQQDDRAVPPAMIGRERVQIGQGEAERAQTHAPDAQEVAPANTGTGSHHALTDRDHRGLSPLAPRNPPISPHQLGSNLPGQSGPRQVPVGFPGARGAAARRWLERNTGVIPVLSILRVSEVLSRLG